MKTTDTTPTSSGDSPQQTDAGVSRRQLVRAGLSAAPVLAVLKSNSVLAAGNAIVPSAFASLKANKGSVSPSSFKTNTQVITPAEWIEKNSPLKKKKFLGSGFVAVGVPVIKNKDKNKNKDKDEDKRKYKDQEEVTLGDVLTCDGTSREAVLARYVVASYLTASEFGDNRDVLALTTSQCKVIWNQKGEWTPFAGARWNYAETIAYFKTIYGIHG